MISLREYNREIEVLIDNSQYDEAIAHCKHILVSFPKCINTYRNLGKTLLESKRYSEALDIFQRVLTAFPDDFISHVGLSIIFEDARDLDQAIWHMEQAFDVQPSNVAIQDELKRLFGRRDGAQPQKIRLSRGALVRMYARGELFQQAIAEIHSTLTEDPKRIDLEVILARMYYLSGSIDEAIETCNLIISRIPFCFEANKILDSIYSKNGNTENASICHSRLISLDPYYRYQTPSNIIQDVPEEKILLEKLVYTPSTAVNTSVPEWTKAIGIQWDEDKVDENPDWLQDINKETDVFTSETLPMETSLHFDSILEETQVTDLSVNSEENKENEIPDWMKTAGWEPSENITGMETTILDESPSGEDLQPILNAEIPDWLLEKSSENKNNITSIGDPLQSFENTVSNSTFEHAFNSEVDTQPDNLRQSLSDWNQEETMSDNISENKDGNNEGTSSPDWLSQFSKNEGEKDTTPPQDLPDWLKNFEQDQSVSENDDKDIPDWLKNLQSVQNSDTPDVIGTEQPVDSSSETLLSEGNSEENPTDEVQSEIFEETDITNVYEPVEMTTTTPQQPPNLPNGWQSELSAKQNLDEPIPNNDIAHSLNNEIPDWVKSVLNSTENTPLEGDESIGKDLVEQIQPVSSDSISSEEIIEKNESLDSQSMESGAISQQTNDDLLEWLRGLNPEDATQEIDNDVLESSDPSIFEKEDPTMASTLDRLDELSNEQTVLEIDQLPSESDLPEDIIDRTIIEKGPDVVEEEITVENLSPDEALSLPKHPSAEEVNSLFSPEVSTSTSTIPIEDSTNSSLEESQSIETPIEIDEEAPVIQTPETSLVDKFNELIDHSDFVNIPDAFAQLLSDGKDFDTLISSLISLSSPIESNYLYWQCLGDIYGQNNKLEDAILSYEKAEEILYNTPNS